MSGDYKELYGVILRSLSLFVEERETCLINQSSDKEVEMIPDFFFKLNVLVLLSFGTFYSEY